MAVKPRIKCLDLNGCSCTARALACVGRYLLISSALSLLTMPITEHLWTWDRFFQTGRDFELGTLMLLTFLCLALVLSKQGKQFVHSLLSICHHLASQFNTRFPAMHPPVAIPLLQPGPLIDPRTGIGCIPLQI